MKKILFIILFFFIYFLQTNALELYLEQWDQWFYINQIKEISPIIIKVNSWSIITKNNWFSLQIDTDSNFRFLNDLSKINISWSWWSKIWTWFSLTPDLRSIKFNVLEDLNLWDNIIISWLQIITFKPQWFKYIWIDINWDLQTDYQTYNGIRIYEDYIYSDIYSPSEIFNLTWSIDNENSIILNADMPWDIDLQAILIENLDLNNNIISSYFKTEIKNFSYKLSNDIKKIKFKTVDFRANYSSWLIYDINYFINNQSWSTINNSTNTSTWEIIFQTWTLTNTWEVIIDKQEIIIDKIIPNFKTKTLANFMIAFDKKIDKRDYKKEVRIVRNEIIQLLKDYEDKKINLKFVRSELVKLVVEFVKVW